MRIPNTTYRLTSCLTPFLIVAVTFVSTPARSAQADEAKRKVTNETANSISAAMESSLEGLPNVRGRFKTGQLWAL